MAIDNEKDIRCGNCFWFGNRSPGERELVGLCRGTLPNPEARGGHWAMVKESDACVGFVPDRGTLAMDIDGGEMHRITRRGGW